MYPESLGNFRPGGEAGAVMRSLVYAFRHTYGTLAQFATPRKVIHTVSRTITINQWPARKAHI
jgi:hypothetical protein